jgi:hypothetical protein
MLHMKNVAKVYRTERVETCALRDLTLNDPDGELVAGDLERGAPPVRSPSDAVQPTAHA